MSVAYLLRCPSGRHEKFVSLVCVVLLFFFFQKVDDSWIAFELRVRFVVFCADSPSI